MRMNKNTRLAQYEKAETGDVMGTFPINNLAARRRSYSDVGRTTSVQRIADVGISLACRRRTAVRWRYVGGLVGCTTWRTRRTADVGPTSGRRGLYDVFYTSTYRRVARRRTDVNIRWRAEVFYVGVPTCFLNLFYEDVEYVFCCFAVVVLSCMQFVLVLHCIWHFLQYKSRVREKYIESYCYVRAETVS